ncbi:MAG TPA: S8 family serine peptidase [Gaiellaceae bacterium]|nr:S8 family serine peptidase [Gaiellaceae bacterium]
MTRLRRFALVLPALLSLTALLLAGGATARSAPAPDGLVEVVVTLPQPALAEAILHDRTLAAAATTRHRLDVRTPASVSYLRTLATAQRSMEARIEQAIPGAATRWHYGVVTNGMAVVLPRSGLARLTRIRGVTVWPSVTYHELLDRTPQLIGAPTIWGPTLATAGQGMKIAIIDDGLDRTHVFFDPTGFTYPAGFPKGNTAYTSAKVIVARAFTAASNTWKYAKLPFDPKYSDHATNVAGIAAGDHNTLATTVSGKFRVSGIAPAAYLGNYKVLTVPTDNFGLDGNSPEIVAGIEAAVKDGMDVLNLSLGEPEVEPTRDIVVQAIDHAADAGVIPVVAAGNDGSGGGSVNSPATAPEAITVAASTEGDSGPADVIAGFSSTGPTPITLEMKPDVTAPGVDILSSLPGNTWSNHDWSGTSMATPHVAGAAALLKQRHPTWTVAQVKSALASTGDPVRTTAGAEVATTREGGGRIDLPRADNPLIFTDPDGLSFGLVGTGTTTTLPLAVTDAGGGPAPWTVTVASQSAPNGALVGATPAVVAGTTPVTVTLTVAADADEGAATGFVLLTRGTDVRRVPYWFRVEKPQLGREPHTLLHGAGLYHGDTAGKPELVSTYRYPEQSVAPAVPLDLSGPEQVFRFDLTRTVANFGAVVVGRGAGVRVSPRLVHAGDENRLVGGTGMPANLNPYQNFGDTTPAVGAILPAKGTYDFVFDTPARGRPGRFTFRVWVNDQTPPSVRLLTPSLPLGSPIRFAVHDSGSGVDPSSIVGSVDGKPAQVSFDGGVVRLDRTIGLGRHSVTLSVADYQETKNMEDIGPVLPNTRVVHTTITVR